MQTFGNGCSAKPNPRHCQKSWSKWRAESNTFLVTGSHYSPSWPQLAQLGSSFLRPHTGDCSGIQRLQVQALPQKDQNRR